MLLNSFFGVIFHHMLGFFYALHNLLYFFQLNCILLVVLLDFYDWIIFYINKQGTIGFGKVVRLMTWLWPYVMIKPFYMLFFVFKFVYEALHKFHRSIDSICMGWLFFLWWWFSMMVVIHCICWPWRRCSLLIVDPWLVRLNLPI